MLTLGLVIYHVVASVLWRFVFILLILERGHRLPVHSNVLTDGTGT